MDGVLNSREVTWSHTIHFSICDIDVIYINNTPMLSQLHYIYQTNPSADVI